MKDITVRAGQEIRINVPYKGVPQPTAKWYIGDNDLDTDSPRTTVQVGGGFLNFSYAPVICNHTFSLTQLWGKPGSFTFG